jgi:hypothetical protein
MAEPIIRDRRNFNDQNIRHSNMRKRAAGCFVGLRPGRTNSGMNQPQLHISKEVDRYLRTMLVQGAHYILGPFGENSDLAAGECGWLGPEARTPKSKPLLPSHRSWQYCFTSCG